MSPIWTEGGQRLRDMSTEKSSNFFLMPSLTTRPLLAHYESVQKCPILASKCALKIIIIYHYNYRQVNTFSTSLYFVTERNVLFNIQPVSDFLTDFQSIMHLINLRNYKADVINPRNIKYIHRGVIVYGFILKMG